MQVTFFLLTFAQARSTETTGSEMKDMSGSENAGQELQVAHCTG